MDAVNVDLFGKDLKVQKALVHAKNIAVSKAPVLVMGEPGVGKRSLAKYIHQNSGRSQKPFEVVDCSGTSQEVENLILGYRDQESGRFNRGILEVANGGTVVFANIDCLDEAFQRKLHKILCELQDYDIDVRLMATTSKNLSKLVGAGRFYRGLFNAVGTNSLYIPPLRERQADIAEMAQVISRQYLNAENITWENEATEKMISHYWTNNVFELFEVVKATLEGIEGGTVTKEDLALGEKKLIPMGGEEDSDGIRLMSLKDAERVLIKKALVHTSENRTQAAKILGVSIRTLRNKINEYRTDGNSYFVNLR